MKSYLRENPTIAFGLGLPLLLVIVFLLISGIPSLLVKPPKYDVLYATDYGGYQNTAVQINVVKQKAQVTYQRYLNNNKQKPSLWRYNPETGAVKEVAIILTSNLVDVENEAIASNEILDTIVINVPDLEKLIIDSSSISPDGYEFSGRQDRNSGNFFGSMFNSSRYNAEATLTKKGRRIRLPKSSRRYYGGNTHFVGWVISQ